MLAGLCLCVGDREKVELKGIDAWGSELILNSNENL